MTRLFVLLGDPVDHSRSPAMQNAAFAAAGVDGVYAALRCDTGAVPGLIRAIARAGGGGNITVPHKRVAAEVVEDATDVVRRTGACNTFWLEDGRIRGDNTDVAAIEASARRLSGDLAGARVLLIGAGGVAAAALLAVIDAGADHITVTNRSPARAEDLIRRLDPSGRSTEIRAVDRLAGNRFDLAINATSLGLRDTDALPLDLGAVDVGAALDLVYRPGGTRWVQHAAATSIAALDGTDILVAQGAAAFERWWRRTAPVEVMHVAAES
jgi:shikimate dehydrogenase